MAVPALGQYYGIDSKFVGAIPFLNATRKSFLTER